MRARAGAEHGRTRMDRPLTPEEPAAQDARQPRATGFTPFRTGTEHEERAKRATRKT